MHKCKKNGLILVLGLLFFTAACSNTAAEDEGVTVKIGVVGEVNEPWEYVKEQLEPEGINIELVTFTDYATPNTALAEGEVDLNAFQTKIFLEAFNEDHDEQLTPIGDTTLNPLGIYSSKINDVNDIQENDVIAIPNDVSNEGRALLLLQTAGLIEVDPEKGQIPLVEDILSNPLNLQIETLDSSQTARALEDVTASVINSGMAVDAGFIPTEDAVFLEPATEESDAYVNVIVARQEDAENDLYLRIVEEYQSDGTKEVIEETTKGSSIPMWQ